MDSYTLVLWFIIVVAGATTIMKYDIIAVLSVFTLLDDIDLILLIFCLLSQLLLNCCGTIIIKSMITHGLITSNCVRVSICIINH